MYGRIIIAGSSRGVSVAFATASIYCKNSLWHSTVLIDLTDALKNSMPLPNP